MFTRLPSAPFAKSDFCILRLPPETRNQGITPAPLLRTVFPTSEIHSSTDFGYTAIIMAFKKVDDPKRTHLQIRLTPDEKMAIENRAFEANETVSSYVLKVCTGRPIRSHTEQHDLNELRLFIVALKDIYHSGTPVNDDRLTPLLEAAVACLNRRVGRPKRG